MHYAHMDIDEVLRAVDDLGARQFHTNPVGYFQLGDEPIGYPIIDLKRTIQKGFDASRVIIMDPGEIVLLKAKTLESSSKAGHAG